jgi:hypothetical protein
VSRHVPIPNPTQNFWVFGFWVLGTALGLGSFGFGCLGFGSVLGLGVLGFVLGFGFQFVPQIMLMIITKSITVYSSSFAEYKQVRKDIIILRFAVNIGLVEKDVCFCIIY